jgi:acetyl-CoA acetyltransferase
MEAAGLRDLRSAEWTLARPAFVTTSESCCRLVPAREGEGRQGLWLAGVGRQLAPAMATAAASANQERAPRGVALAFSIIVSRFIAHYFPGPKACFL